MHKDLLCISGYSQAIHVMWCLINIPQTCFMDTDDSISVCKPTIIMRDLGEIKTCQKYQITPKREMFLSFPECCIYAAPSMWKPLLIYSRCLCDPESSGTIRTLSAPADSTGTIKRVCWHKSPKWRPLKTCRGLSSHKRTLSVSKWIK